MNIVIWAFLHILYASILVSVFIALLLLVKKLLPNRIPARVFHIMWLLIFLRLLIPVQFTSPFSIFNLITENIPMLTVYQENQSLITDLSSTYQSFAQPDRDVPATKASNNVPAGNTFNLQLFLRGITYIWIIGWAILILSGLVFTIRFRKRLKTSEKVADAMILELAEQCGKKLKIKRRVPLYMNKFFKGPGILGVIHPAIYLPEDINAHVNPDQLEHILLHELGHYKRGDLICNLVSLLVAMIHWFNPLVWLAVKTMRQEREVACDTLVLEVLGEPYRMAYGKTILNLARLFANQYRQADLISFNENSGQVERRIKMINRFKTGSYKLSVMAVVLCLVVGAVFLTDAISEKPSLNTMTNLLGNERLQNQLVVIDPGHGGDDVGAVFISADAKTNQVTEKDLNLDIALKLYEILKKAGIKVEMTRMDDRNLTLDERINMANENNAALVISIHNNSSPNRATHGTECYFYSNSDLQNSVLTNRRFTELLQKKLVAQLQTEDRGVKEVNSRILRESNAPAVMVNVGYFTNKADRQNLMDAAFQDRTARALYDGIIQALNEMADAGTKTSQKDS
ncbi:MAG: M56/M15 family metallopeptidase [Syntrophomonas sp.]